MSYRITCYCSACNSPRDSTQTSSGETATEGVTVAVHRSKYSKNKQIYIDGIGSRKIQDIHGNSPNVIDVYLGNRSICKCEDNIFSNKKLNVTGM